MGLNEYAVHGNSQTTLLKTPQRMAKQMVLSPVFCSCQHVLHTQSAPGSSLNTIAPVCAYHTSRLVKRLFPMPNIVRLKSDMILLSQPIPREVARAHQGGQGPQEGTGGFD